MKTNFPIRKLIIINWWLTVNFVLFIVVFILANYGVDALFRASINGLFGFFNLLFISFSNTGLIYYMNKKRDYFLAMPERQRRRLFVLISYSLNLVFVFIILGIYSIWEERIEFGFVTTLSIIVLTLLMNTFILVLQHYVLLQDEKTHMDLENSKLRAVNSETSNQLLRQQIHPHFLFNALNVLKSLYRVRPNDGEEYLLHLSEFLRAAVSKNNTKIISLKEELELCSNYVEMQKIRFDAGLQYSVNISVDMMTKGFVPSFSIQPLLENAIKHNKLTDELPLSIEIIQQGERVRVINNLNLKTTSEESTGSGLSNLSERYRLLSGDGLHIEEKDNCFAVSIKVLNEANVKSLIK